MQCGHDAEKEFVSIDRFSLDQIVTIYAPPVRADSALSMNKTHPLVTSHHINRHASSAAAKVTHDRHYSPSMLTQCCSSRFERGKKIGYAEATLLLFLKSDRPVLFPSRPNGSIKECISRTIRHDRSNSDLVRRGIVRNVVFNDVVLGERICEHAVDSQKLEY